MKESFRINYPKSDAGKKQWAKAYGTNAYWAGKHWSRRKEDAEYWHDMTRAAMCAAHCRRQPFEKPVVITILWNDRLDIDNHSIMGKMIVDALKGRVIADDSRQFVRGVCNFFHSEDCIKVVIQEVDADACSC